MRRDSMKNNSINHDEEKSLEEIIKLVENMKPNNLYYSFKTIKTIAKKRLEYIRKEKEVKHE
jgi:hypothetical protein